MSVLVACPSCATRLKVGEHLLGKRVKCPSCSGTFLAEEPPIEVKPEEHVTERVRAKRSQSIPDEAIIASPPPLPKKRARDDDDDDDDDDAPIERPRKKKKGKKKKKAKRTATWILGESTSWPWWVFGGGGIVAVQLLMMTMAIFLPFGHPAKFLLGYLFVALPISTLIFFAAMYLSSIWFGALEIGELPVALVKAYILVSIVTIVGLVPCGFIFTLLIWFAGILTLFRLDPWETRILVFMNWILNVGIKILLLLMLASWARHAGGGFDGGMAPGPAMVVDMDDND